MHRGCELWREVTEALVDHLLSGVSPVVTRDFADALEDWRTRGDVEVPVPAFARHFADHAVAMTLARDVIALLASQPARRISG